MDISNDQVPQLDPQNPENPPISPPNTKKSRQAKKTAPAENIQELGTPQIPVAKSNIHVMTIIGQIEGHPSMRKRPKYWSCVLTPKCL